MNMAAKIIQLGWKNIWRSPTRSGVVIIAVLLGTWAGIFISSFMNGMLQGYLQNQLNLSVGHLQITDPRFEDQFNPQFGIENSEEVLDTLRQMPFVWSLRPQSLSTGLAQSASNSYGVTIHGFDPETGTQHPVAEMIEEGSMLEGVRLNPIVIGDELAERLDLELGSRMVISFQDITGEITGGAFRVAGIYSSSNQNYDRSNVFTRAEDLNGLLGEASLMHKITVMVDDYRRAPEYARELEQLFPDLRIATWGAIAPELQYVYNSTDLTLYIVMVIIIIALVFSIVNTMLMAILERTRELGMLMAVGMNRSRLFLMILAETFFLTMVGTPLGLALSWGTVSWFGDTGIDLGAFGEGLSAYGMTTVIYPELTSEYYLNITVLIAVAALISALYPAWKTLKLKPVEAIRKI